MIKYISNLQDISKNDATIVGGKGASLGEMIGAGFLVPPGFVITTDAFRSFMESGGLGKKIEGLIGEIEKDEIKSVERIAEEIATLIARAAVSNEVVEEIELAYQGLEGGLVAVRSSATTEDGSESAWAGQLESYLNITHESLLENVKKCWGSLFSPRALAYRLEKGAVGDIAVAVVVQKMVKSEAAGTAFSVHPVSQDPDLMVVEAVRGLGDAVVSGRATPDSYVIRKSDLHIISKNVQQAEAVLSDKEIQELSDLILKIENHYGFPCDIEWALEKEKFYILQSRPITTLDHKFIRQFRKFFTREIPLIAMEYWHQGEFQGLPELLEGATRFNPLFVRNQNGQTGVYYDMNNPETALQPLFDFFVEKPEKFNKFVEEFKAYQSELDDLIDNFKPNSSVRLSKTIATVWAYLPIWVQLGSSKNVNPEFSKKSLELRDLFQKYEYQAAQLLCDTIKERHPELEEYVDVISFNEVESDTIPGLEELKERKKSFIYFEGKVIAGVNLKEFQEKFSVKLNEDLATIGELDHQLLYEKKMMLMAKRHTNIFEASLRVQSWSEALSKELGFGYQTIVINSEGEYYVDIESENKIDGILRSKESKDALDYINKMYDLRKKILKEMKEGNTDLNAKFSKLFTYFFLARRVAENIFEKSDPEEQKVIESWRSDETLFEPLDLFYENHPQEESKEVWSVIFYDNHLRVIDKKLSWKSELDTPEQIKGSTAFPGMVTGRVVIVRNKSDLSRIKDGDIMISAMTSPDYVMALRKAAAFITDEGGITSHAAISARELKKPCIIGTKVATQILKDGDLVEVDADNGIVRILNN
ncbi:MAG: hypothetical protein A3C88_02870 [Candidatus Yanofskybacteria bacterium RIFCSPHIGHO2_02_FULL_50_12]|uniref:Phosphoenolpyruvate synthase n=1 Tax=Candidatus Yanofskybacteria bacterium RIFCSPHIGHO2_02_FULL_50_12 TaxID=1802685 RepID=A0A1F8FTI3_9BACT|nr:MAG: hypothetical protein A3C88_02870 [Candidatus Yanofskybacteria bacterium RIFCSPHIGHO2_02_FULL_50_12]